MPSYFQHQKYIYSIPSDSVQSPLWSGKHESSDHGDQDSSLLLESEMIKKVQVKISQHENTSKDICVHRSKVQWSNRSSQRLNTL